MISPIIMCFERGRMNVQKQQAPLQIRVEISENLHHL